MTIFTMALADAGASLKKGIERVIGTVVGGLAGLLAVIAFIDLPYVFVPLMGVAITVGLYLSHVLAAPYPPLLGALTYLLVVLSQVEAPEDYVGVALWRITAIVIGVVLSTVAQVFLWPDDPVDKLREALVRRLHLVPMLIDRAIAPPAGPAVELPAVALTLGDLTGELQLLADAEVLHSSLRPRNAEHIALILEVARLFTAAVWAAETTPGTTARVGLDEGARRRLLAIRDESIRFARALEGRRSLLASAAPMAGVTSVEAGSSQFVSAQDARARRHGTLARPHRLPHRHPALREGPHHGAAAGAPFPSRRARRDGFGAAVVARHRRIEGRAQDGARRRALLSRDAGARLAGAGDLHDHLRDRGPVDGGRQCQESRAPPGGRRARRPAGADRHRRLHAEPRGHRRVSGRHDAPATSSPGGLRWAVRGQPTRESRRRSRSASCCSATSGQPPIS